MDKEKNEKIALAVGFFLILLVIVITLLRSDLLADSDDPLSGGRETQDESLLGYKTVNAKDLQNRILLAGRSGGITLLDVRPFESYAAEHIVDAVNVAPADFPVGAQVDAHSLVVVVGAKSGDSDVSKAVDQLKKENFTDFLVLAGGMESWKQLVGVTVNYGDPNSFVDQSKVAYVEAEKVRDALKQEVPMLIVDVRDKEDYDKGHIPGARNIPAEELEKRRSEIAEKKAVVVGINELQEFQASVQMYDMLLVSPFVLKGGMPEWENKGFPLVK